MSLGHIDKEAKIFFSLNDSEFKIYKTPIAIDNSSTLKVYASKNDQNSATITSELIKIDANLSMKLCSPYANQYNAGGDDALIDGRRGGTDFRSGAWQGFHDQDLEATVMLNQPKPLSQLDIAFIMDQRSWIFFPSTVEVFISSYGIQFQSIGKKTIENATPSDATEIKTILMTWSKRPVKAVKVIATNLGALPEWHIGYPYDCRSWIFTDEIILN